MIHLKNFKLFENAEAEVENNEVDNFTYKELFANIVSKYSPELKDSIYINIFPKFGGDSRQIQLVLDKPSTFVLEFRMPSGKNNRFYIGQLKNIINNIIEDLKGKYSPRTFNVVNGNYTNGYTISQLDEIIKRDNRTNKLSISFGIVQNEYFKRNEILRKEISDFFNFDLTDVEGSVKLFGDYVTISLGHTKEQSKENLMEIKSLIVQFMNSFDVELNRCFFRHKVKNNKGYEELRDKNIKDITEFYDFIDNNVLRDLYFIFKIIK